ncbi:hypothetical protein BCR33DRAFT_838772 [Rhizoclosmatium globosum]|uniref:RBR-type E3 ubiquitin transferase n=1 Tax=Rhizoclosmatium globosum TaxID=329046 RepID=A0A1Y2BFD1_9FUNG|nr:hypothetical protein BCR33DRAFT_838772 [Rhizoclosmatium globosum]|eukprot:ORY33270.1 hypothetical protein BCR33DRAFT_838772 [Rhizoclosmatium globosum]
MEELIIKERPDELLQCLACKHDGTQANNDVFALQCGHAMCKSFWSHYFWVKFINEQSNEIKCPLSKCTQTISPNTVSLLSTQFIADKYESLQFEAYSKNSLALTECPVPDCTNFISWDNISMLHNKSFIPTVTCSCDHNFCFSCKIPNHEPAPCAIASSWMTKVREYESIAWIAANTKSKILLCYFGLRSNCYSKECPKCSVSIANESGLMSTECPNCRHEFCWKCLKTIDEYHSHFYFTESQAPMIQHSVPKADCLEDFILFDTPQKMEVPIEAKQVLQDSHGTLKWSYCLMFHLIDNLARERLQFNLAQLRAEVDSLTNMWTTSLGCLNLNVSIELLVQQVAQVTKKRDMLLKMALADLREGLFVLSDENNAV